MPSLVQVLASAPHRVWRIGSLVKPSSSTIRLIGLAATAIVAAAIGSYSVLPFIILCMILDAWFQIRRGR